MENLEFLRKLQELGVSFCVSIPSPEGGETHIATPEELVKFPDDPIALYASHYGVSKSQYLSWANEEFSVRCPAKTRKGKRCKAIVKGGYNVEPLRWVELTGEYCVIHGEGLE